MKAVAAGVAAAALCVLVSAAVAGRAAPPGWRTLRSFEITVGVPPGWDSQMYSRAGAGALPSVVHLASFPLPRNDDDDATRAVRAMGPRDVLVVMLELPPEQAGTQGFVPLRSRLSVGAADLAVVAGRAVARKRFAAHGRPFFLRVEFGSPAPAADRLSLANAVLRTIAISPRPELDRTNWTKLRRPLHLPAATSRSCPRSTVKTHAPRVRFILGDGPAYLSIGTADGVAPLRNDRLVGGWYQHKTLWAVSPRYSGPLLIRGRRIDAPGEVRFIVDRTLSELELPGLAARAKAHWRYAITATLVRGPGCYAFQVDGSSFSSVAVFEARR